MLKYILISSKWFPELEATGSWLLGPQGMGESFPVGGRLKAEQFHQEELGIFFKEFPRKRT